MPWCSPPPTTATRPRRSSRALTAAGYGGAKLWLTSQNLADYSQALPAGLLNGANGILEGVQPDDAFIAKLKQEDPGLVDPRYGAEAYDATILAALAAILAGDDGGASIAAALRDASRGGIKCTSFGECLDVLRTETDIDYDGHHRIGEPRRGRGPHDGLLRPVRLHGREQVPAHRVDHRLIGAPAR